MRVRNDEMLHRIFGAGSHSNPAFAAARLALIGIDRSTLQIAAASHRHRDVLALHQIFEIDIAGILDDLRPALVTEGLSELP